MQALMVAAEAKAVRMAALPGCARRSAEARMIDKVGQCK